MKYFYNRKRREHGGRRGGGDGRNPSKDQLHKMLQMCFLSDKILSSPVCTSPPGSSGTNERMSASPKNAEAAS